ncbi:MAG TPA: DUF1146 domain-containing protein [Acholeplasmataceae bacterium]|jgi:uncharacterized integral membrane protein (TIGR02327 family)|nr:DUF1146 domain-containing protein [Acholeplasmataceae bacterium]
MDEVTFAIVKLVWFIVILVVVALVTYRALGAVDYSKIFKARSTWQIRILVLLISIIVGGLVGFIFLEFIGLLQNVFK